MANPDSYYLRTEVSNSDLTELKNYLYPRTQYGDKEKAFKFGTLVDALITENEREIEQADNIIVSAWWMM